MNYFIYTSHQFNNTNVIIIIIIIIIIITILITIVTAKVLVMAEMRCFFEVGLACENSRKFFNSFTS